MAQSNDGDVWICGGQAIYEEAMPLADRLYLTLIDAEYEGDVFFPPWEDQFTNELARREMVLDGLRLVFVVLER
jgi:dihydrofolate reductase